MAGQDWQPIWEPRADHPNDPIFPQPVRSMYRGGEFGYTRLVETKEKLTFSYVGNHDGDVHDMIEILASGHVLNGGSATAGVMESDSTCDKAESGSGSGSGTAGGRGLIAETTVSWYVKGASIVVLGAFVGYVLGFISSRFKKRLLQEATGLL